MKPTTDPTSQPLPGTADSVGDVADPLPWLLKNLVQRQARPAPVDDRPTRESDGDAPTVDKPHDSRSLA